MLNLLYSNKKIWIWLAIVLIAFAVRGSSLVVEFYDVDEISEVLMTTEIINGGKVYVDAIPGRPVYFAFFYAVFSLFGAGNIIALHFVAILWILATALYLYKINLKLFSQRAGYFAALFYVIFVSIFLEYYLAVHGEVIYNLPVVLAIFIFIKAESNERSLLNYILTGIVLGIAVLAKMHTLLTLIFLGFYLVIVKSFVLKKLWQNIRSFSLIIAGFSGLLVLFLLLLTVLDVRDNFISFYLTGGVGYAKQGLSFINADTLLKVFNKLGQNIAAQLFLWLMLLFFLFRLRSDLKNLKLLMLFFFFGASFTGIFLGGARLYNHYFLQYLPALCLIAGYTLNEWVPSLDKKKKRLWLMNILIICPMVFFAGWNYLNAYYSHYAPDKAFPENHGVVPRKEYKAVSHWIKANSEKEDRIVQWGDCIEIYYFAQRPPGIRFLWSNYFAMKYWYLLAQNPVVEREFQVEKLNKKKRLAIPEQWTFKNPVDLQYSVILDLDKKKPRYIIDTAESNFRDFAKNRLNGYPVLFDYITKHYHLVKTIDKMEIYEIMSRN